MARTMLAEQKIAQYLKLKPNFTQLTSKSEQTSDQKVGKRPAHLCTCEKAKHYFEVMNITFWVRTDSETEIELEIIST